MAPALGDKSLQLTGPGGSLQDFASLHLPALRVAALTLALCYCPHFFAAQLPAFPLHGGVLGQIIPFSDLLPG